MRHTASYIEDNMKYNQFIKAIIEASQANTWDLARSEWSYTYSDFVPDDEELDECICGHGIRECCVITNNLNGNELVVGNCCVKKFMPEFGQGTLFAGLKRIIQNRYAAPNSQLIEEMQYGGRLTTWEIAFLKNTMKKRKLSYAQSNIRFEINQKIIYSLKSTRSKHKHPTTPY